MVNFLRDQNLMLQKIPEQLEIVEALPRNASGKILKRALRDRLAETGPSIPLTPTPATKAGR